MPRTAITRDGFRREAAPLAVHLPDSASITAKPRELAGGSLGWAGGGTVYVRVGDAWVEARVTLTLTIPGSAKL